MRKNFEMLNGVKLNESISHGTLRNYDLFCVYADVLDGTEDWELLMDNNPDINIGAMLCAQQCDADGWWDTESAIEAVALLSDTIGEYAPEGYYFGAHPGDGSDFGFWEYQHCSVWVGGVEVNDHYVTGSKANEIAEEWRSKGYDDVQIECNNI